MSGAVIGLGLGLGLVLAVSGWVRGRRPALDDRVTPYVRDVHPALPSGTPQGVGAALVAPGLRAVGASIGEWIGSAASVRRRLDRAGSALSVEDFRLRQLAWGAVGFGVAATLSLLVWLRQGSGSAGLLVASVAAGLGAAMASDQRLSAAVRRREERMLEELPAVADLLALAVAAGESPSAALRRVVQVARGDLADELTRVLGEVHTGTTMVQAFDALAARTGVAGIARFAEGLAVAIDRGTPLVDVLHAQTADVRDAARRRLMESGGRREVLMMIPVVFAILPVTVVFAFYPGLVGLHLTSGS